MYKATTHTSIIRIADNAFIPMDPGNTDYQAYLAWVAEGNEPLPPDTLTPEEILENERNSMVCSRFQALAALHLAGLLEPVETAIASADTITQLAWANALEFRRNSPTIASLGALIGMTDEQLDDLFRTAMTIQA